MVLHIGIDLQIRKLLSVINIEIMSFHVQVVTISCSSSIISKDTRKKNDGVIGCDEQGTTITPPIGLDVGAVNIYCLLHDKMIYKMKNIDTY
jgi:hypothetical protein